MHIIGQLNPVKFEPLSFPFNISMISLSSDILLNARKIIHIATENIIIEEINKNINI